MSVGTRVALRVDPGQLGLVMNHLDRVDAAHEISAKRRYARHPYRTRTPLLLACQRTDGTVCYEVAPRNLSARGLSVLFNGFIHPQTSCHLALPTLTDTTVHIPGRIRWCRHISRTIHEGGIEFNDRIDLSLFIADAPVTERSEVELTASEIYRLIEEQATRLARLAHDQRSLEELKDPFTKIRRLIEREENGEPEWVQ